MSGSHVARYLEQESSFDGGSTSFDAQLSAVRDGVASVVHSGKT